MPHVVRARDVPMRDRRPHMVAYIDQLRRVLRDPSLPERSRSRYQAQLDRLRAEMRAAAEG